MISEIVFARDFSSFWRITTPTIEGFVRRLNSGLYDRDFGPLRAATAPDRRSFVNEVAFELFCGRVAAAQRGEERQLLDDMLRSAAAVVREAATRMLREGDYDADLSQEECDDVREQVRRLIQRLLSASPLTQFVLRPQFPDCGTIDTCHGDVLAGEILFEIKAGARAFRSIDVKQLVTYLALNHASRRYAINLVGLVNPRIGISVEMTVSEFCYEVSGRDAAGLLGSIVHGISSGDISR